MKPSAWILAGLGVWLGASLGGWPLGILGGGAFFTLGWVAPGLLWDESWNPLPASEPTPVLPPGRETKNSPLSPAMRSRFRSLHARCQTLAEIYPKAASEVSSPDEIHQLPEIFRGLARRWDRIEGEDARARLEAQMDELEAGVERIEELFALLVEDGGEEEELRELEDLQDRLEALAEVSRLLPEV